MKRVFTRQTTLMLAVSIALSTAGGLTPVQAKSVWNPMSWFSESSTSQDEVTQAQKKADEAQQAADQALIDAQKAMQKAEQAKQEAQALQQKAEQKPAIKTPDSTTSVDALPATSPTKDSTAPPAESTATTSTPDTHQETQQAEAPKTQTSSPDSTPQQAFGTPNFTTVKSEPWNPLTWFKKPEEKQPDASQEASTDTAKEKPDATTDTNAQTSEPAASDTTNKTATDAPKSKGWNWFPKLAPQAASTQAPTKETTEQSPITADGTLDPAIKTKAALIETEKGNIAIELYPDQAPETVANFVSLINEGFYNRFNMKFHRVVPGFVVQTGDPTGTGAGGSKKTIPLEAKNKLSHNAKGVVAMARGADPNSATSQFYITLAPQTSLDGKYAIFGKVISGMDVLDKIEKGDMMYGIRLVDLNSVVRDPAPEKKKFFSSLF